MEEMKQRDSILERARRLATATLGDALDAFDIPGVMSGITRRTGSGRVAGFAQTMLQQAAPLGSFSFEDFAVGSAFDATSLNSVLVVDMGSADVSTFGGLAALTLTLHKAAGAIVDGGCRDVEEIARLRLTVASRTVTPRTGKGRLRIVSRGEAITCGGVCVRPDDLVVMDDTGIVVVPQDKILAVLTAAEELDRRDADFAERLKTDGSFARAAASLKHA
ncbi:RraA family protein [Bradyrhizobium sp. ISRA443]|uniref:RraA family protein n=1 Tax=unclassified Bradyrhizobium TaxID=2631580 RepID=UPI0024795C39|nr:MULTISPECIES: RraA family protein [unclassified Bradyrhizobium]WGR93416.1 RraA family protein [Bradyrhizobium sp. ISRA435]WGR97954.1 RraA family protein [Bradyrhizobium sp. ISRA436]WGS04844.1 RraA family protein [Bradyrhizobium sp. ISRA437]WGS11725.1 RraA family protein [Bradyrhizobium sp. ISRA443]